ncbi:M14 family zinc carboxypeptidase [Changchengzhania lutea]|uniref:M14 family zinc carboxypeptidase n=1 Tax=Changchengzhania lutea TaxID=2049305 RepID=UPI00115EE262|nr:M14 family zinc carboxypeptidase [Changchengzhania lutea]
MTAEDYKLLFEKFKESTLHGRYITYSHIKTLLDNFSELINVSIVGQSILKNPTHTIQIGSGKKRILMWSQMHGNESTTTKAVFDLLNTLLSNDSSAKKIIETCTICIIPILNPDGAQAYTRVNANKVDLNRDAQDQSQPESRVLMSVFEAFKPHFCYNLHGQRTIFSAGHANRPATVSFLAPAQDKACSLTTNRKIAMEIISVMNDTLQVIIPDQVGVYDDSFNLNCVGDTFQSFNVPTILFEAGHYNNDYNREVTRAYIYIALLASLNYISKNTISGSRFKSYFNIPENQKLFYDVILRHVKMESIQDIGILYQEKIKEGKIEFIPKVEKIGNLDGYYGHREIDANESEVLDKNGNWLKIGNENVCVILNNEKTSLL